jgi:trehalose 6-phosphate phosphatase
MSRPRCATPHVFEAWERVEARVRASGKVIVFLDFDGTLVKIAPLPDQVKLSISTRRVLQKLARNRRVKLVIISGRRRVELQHYIGIRKMEYLGLYGWEHGASAKLSPSSQIALFRAHANLLAELAAYPGVWIEPKRNSFSIHLLGSKRNVQTRVRERVHKLLQPLRHTLQVFQNLRDIEVLPVAIEDKGAAVRKFLKQPAHRGALPIYFGDDLSDEPAFAAVRRGISILVGQPRASKAHFFLRGPEEVTAALSRVEAILA